HKPVSAEDYAEVKEQVAGSIGHGLEFDGTYIAGPLTVWDGDAIKLIESDHQRQLSASYRYTPDMTPGEYQGQRYDGVMRKISGNHVALVPQGRAGPDVLVQDSAWKKNVSFKAFRKKQAKDSKPKEMNMAKSKMSLQAAVAKGALMAHLAPMLAADAAIDL